MLRRLSQAVFVNFGLKVVAVFLAVLLYVLVQPEDRGRGRRGRQGSTPAAAASEEPTSVPTTQPAAVHRAMSPRRHRTDASPEDAAPLLDGAPLRDGLRLSDTLPGNERPAQ